MDLLSRIAGWVGENEATMSAVVGITVGRVKVAPGNFWHTGGSPPDSDHEIVISGFRYSPEEPECSDSLDNDGDGLADYPGDSGCFDASDPSEDDPLFPCDDGDDNDDDGRTDYDWVTFASPGGPYTRPAGSGDPGCKDPTWTTESPQCQDGVNNDLGQDPNTGPALIDYDGGQTIQGYCSDGTCPPGVSDPDGDGNADPDPQCAGKPWKNQERKPPCGLGAELALLLLPMMWLGRRRKRTLA